MEYVTRRLRARTKLKHEGAEIARGEIFTATETDARYLTRVLRAEDAPAARPAKATRAVAAPPPAPPVEGSSVESDLEGAAGDEGQA